MAKKAPRTIVLPHEYQNATGVVIAAGHYADDDDALHGLADYLVDSGHAVIAGAPSVPAVPPVVTPDEPEYSFTDAAHNEALTKAKTKRK